jgi:hypothetical protein
MYDLVFHCYFLGIEISSISGFLFRKKKIHNLLAHAALSYEHTIETPTRLNVHLPDGDRVSDLMCYHHFIEVLSI